MANFEKKTLKIFEGFCILFIVGGIILTPSTILISQFFPKTDLEPNYVFGDYNWTENFSIAQEGICIIPIYLDYGEAINCFYYSNIPINFYIFDVNGFLTYMRNPISQAINNMKASYSGFVRFMPSTPGYCWILIVNPVRYYKACGEVTFYKYYALPIITSGNEYNFCLQLSILGITTSALGVVFYIILRRKSQKFKTKNLPP